MNALCTILTRDLKSAEQAVLREEQHGKALKKALAKFHLKEAALKAELARLQKSVMNKRYRLDRRKKENDELLTLDWTQEERAELKATQKELHTKLDEVDKSQVALNSDRQTCESSLGEAIKRVQAHVASLAVESTNVEVEQEPSKLVFKDLKVYRDVKNKGCVLVHVETNSGSFLCIMKDYLNHSSSKVSCEFSRIIYMHKGALKHLDPITGIKNVAELNAEENTNLNEFSSAIEHIRSKLRRMLVNAKVGKPTTLQLPMAQPVQDLHERYSELAWSLARDAGFTVFPINPDDPYVQSGEALKQGAFKMPDDSGQIVCVGVMTFIFPKLSKVTLTEANMPDEESNAPDEIVSAVYNVKEQTWSELVSRSKERLPENAGNPEQSLQVTLLLSALDHIEVAQEKLLGLTGRLKSFVKNL